MIQTYGVSGGTTAERGDGTMAVEGGIAREHVDDPVAAQHLDPAQETWSVTSPATGDVIGRVEWTPIEAVPRLYARARAAQRSWRALSVQERVRYVERLRLIVVDRLEFIARRVAESTGKTETEVLTTELLLVLSALQYTERHAPRVLRRRRMPTPILLAGKHSYIEYMPKGVVLVIAPWNFPLQLALIPVISAVAAGNAVILKPSEVTPLVGTLIEELVVAAGFPPHVIQVAHGGGALGAALVSPGAYQHAQSATGGSGDRPDHIFFTGSLRTGKLIQAEAAKHLIPTTLELSGKDAMLVFSDAPMERAVNAAVWGGFMNCGQVCMGVERLYVQREAYGEFTQRLLEQTGTLRQGVQSDADLGSMTFATQVDIVKEQVQDALSKGATLIAGPPPTHWEGMFIPPVIIGDVAPHMKIAREETFGPVITVAPFDTEDEAIALVNASEYGLNASVWSKDISRARRVATQLQSGSVVINDVIITVANQHLPFGGIKQSGLGRYHGEDGLKTFSHAKAVMRNWLGRSRDVNWFPYEGKASLFAALLRNYFKERTNWAGFLGAFVGLLRRSR